MKQVYESESEGSNRKGRPLGRWKDRMEECLGERGINGRGVLEQARKDCRNRERWGGKFPQEARHQSYRSIDR